MMDSKRFEDKLDKVVDKIASIDSTLSKQSAILDEHVKRSNLLEAKLVPVEKHVAMVSGALKALGILSTTILILKTLGLI